MKAKVSVVKCFEYKEVKVDKALVKAVNLAGGLNSIINRGDNVLIKVNLLQAKPPQTAINSNPLVVKSLIKLLKDLGANPLIGDSPGGAFLNIEKTWQISGMHKIAKETGAKLVKFEDATPVKIYNPGGKFFKNFYISRPIIEADKIISLPKLKTHGMVIFTGSIKNMLGVVPGLLKVEFHRRCPKPEDLALSLVELFSLIKPHFSIMDAIVALEGDGPNVVDLSKRT